MDFVFCLVLYCIFSYVRFRIHYEYLHIITPINHWDKQKENTLNCRFTGLSAKSWKFRTLATRNGF